LGGFNCIDPRVVTVRIKDMLHNWASN
jgi:hypothetical protein